MQTDLSHTTPACASRAFAHGDADHAVSLARAVAAAQCRYQSCIPGSAEFHAATAELDRCESAFIAARPDSIAGALCKLAAVSNRLGVCAEDIQHPAVVLPLPAPSAPCASSRMANRTRCRRCGRPRARWPACPGRMTTNRA